MAISNETIKNHTFLAGMLRDSYFPNNLVEKGQQILLRLCEAIESQKPSTDEDVYKLTHAATEEFNDLQEEFWQQESEIETVARDCIAVDFEFVAQTYGYDLDIEELVAPRDW
jgi:hypothetical protein